MFYTCLHISLTQFNREGKLGRLLSQQGYAFYLICIPSIVFITFGLRGIDLEPVLKMGLVSLIVIPACFVAAFPAQKVPMVSETP